jgi:hypothetical protein
MRRRVHHPSCLDLPVFDLPAGTPKRLRARLCASAQCVAVDVAVPLLKPQLLVQAIRRLPGGARGQIDCSRAGGVRLDKRFSCKRLSNALSSISFVNDDVFYDCADTRRNSESDQGQHSDKITGSADRKHDRSRRLDDGLQLFPSRGLCRRGQLTDQSSDRIGHRWSDRRDFLDLKPSHLRSSGCRRRLRGSRARSGRPPRTSRACALPTPGSRPRPPVPACSTRRGPAPMSRLRL